MVWLSRPDASSNGSSVPPNILPDSGVYHVILNGGLIWYRLAGHLQRTLGFYAIFRMPGMPRPAKTAFADLDRWRGKRQIDPIDASERIRTV